VLQKTPRLVKRDSFFVAAGVVDPHHVGVDRFVAHWPYLGVKCCPLVLRPDLERFSLLSAWNDHSGLLILAIVLVLTLSGLFFIIRHSSFISLFSDPHNLEGRISMVRPMIWLPHDGSVPSSWLAGLYPPMVLVCLRWDLATVPMLGFNLAPRGCSLFLLLLIWRPVVLEGHIHALYFSINLLLLITCKLLLGTSPWLGMGDALLSTYIRIWLGHTRGVPTGWNQVFVLSHLRVVLVPVTPTISGLDVFQGLQKA
jgi:hypothetical protein